MTERNHIFFFAEYQLYSKAAGHLRKGGGGGVRTPCTLPLDLPLEVYSKFESEPKHEVATIEREFKFRKRMAFSVLGSLRTVPLYSTLAVNNLGLKFVS